jgi:glycosyltransferase involved in cell wall biosynthesis
MSKIKVSFLIPTYNAERFLPSCLKSIRDQSYPQEDLEIIVADGGSTDSTRRIAQELGARVIENPQRLGEAGKLLALKAAQGMAIVFMDADNEIVGKEWLADSLEALESSSELLGVEAFYIAHPEDTSLNHYLTTLLHINDPIAQKMAAPLREISETSKWNILEIQSPYNFPTGANGFMFRRETLDKVFDEHDFHESEWSRRLIQQGFRKIAMLKDSGVAHHYVSGLSDLWKKRKHAGALYLKRQNRYGSSWFMARGKLRLIGVCLWYALILPAFMEALYKARRDHSSAWLWHPVVGVVTLFNHISTFLMNHFLSDSNREKQIYEYAARSQDRR